MHSKASLLTLSCGEVKYSLLSGTHVGPSKVNGQLLLKRPELPDGFQGRAFKGRGERAGHRLCDQLTDISDWLW